MKTALLATFARTALALSVLLPSTAALAQDALSPPELALAKLSHEGHAAAAADIATAAPICADPTLADVPAQRRQAAAYACEALGRAGLLTAAQPSLEPGWQEPGGRSVVFVNGEAVQLNVFAQNLPVAAPPEPLDLNPFWYAGYGIGASVAAVGAGYLGWFASENARLGTLLSSGAPDTEVFAQQAKVTRLRDAGTAIAAVGGALVVTTAVLHVLDDQGMLFGPDSPVDLSTGVGPQGFSVAAQGRF